jgi:hypothetical protein
MEPWFFATAHGTLGSNYWAWNKPDADSRPVTTIEFLQFGLGSLESESSIAKELRKIGSKYRPRACLHPFPRV